MRWLYRANSGNLSEYSGRFMRNDFDYEFRPSNCRERLQEEGAAYPKSGCEACTKGLAPGCPYEMMGIPQKHYPGCWMDHHECAIKRIRRKEHLTGTVRYMQAPDLDGKSYAETLNHAIRNLNPNQADTIIIHDNGRECLKVQYPFEV